MIPVLSDQVIILAFALAAAPLYLALGAALRADTLAVPVRLGLWVIAAIAVALVGDHLGYTSDALPAIGLKQPTRDTLLAGLAGTGALMIGGGIVALFQRMLGLPIGDREGFQRLAARAWPQRLLIAATAAVVEEVLYRGIGVGFGAAVFGSALTAAAVSTAVFTVAHFRWAPAHLLQVLIAGAVLSALFVYTGDLAACIIAHFLVDFGLVVAPAFIRREPQAES